MDTQPEYDNSDYLGQPDVSDTEDVEMDLPQAVEDPNRKLTYLIPPSNTYGRARNILEQMDLHLPAPQRAIKIFHPFTSRKEWELAKFLSQSLNQTQTDAFLKLEWTRNLVDPLSPSFRSALKLRDSIEGLPGGPRWQLEELSVTGYPTEKPIRLLYRSGKEAVLHLLANPVFSNHIELNGREEQVLRGGNWFREYSEFSTGDYFERLHVHYNGIIEGATVVGVILASDKTHVTTGTGGVHMHPVFLTISNIHAAVRQKASSQAWLCIGFLPIPEFAVHSETQTLLAARIWHRCLDIITASLKDVAVDGTIAVDPSGMRRYIFTPLVAYTADLPEQQLIACVSKNSSPVSTATLDSFGDGDDDPPPRTGVDTLTLITTVCGKHDPWRLPEFLDEAKANGLSGVNLPFWRNWNMTDPSLFLAPEILHTCHKYFYDHVLVWCKAVLGAEELDRRFRCLHKRVGYRHFASGVTHLNQMTGREHRDIQRSIVAVIAGSVSPGFLRAIRATIDFIYIAQFPAHTKSTILAMTSALREFHENKQHILDAGARAGKKGAMDHFNIPKLELFNSFERAIINLGSIMQYTADVSERLLITTCKHTFRATNHNSFWDEQCADKLDREEKIRMFDLYTLLRDGDQSLINDEITSDDITITDMLVDSHPEAAWIARILPETRLRGPRLARNLFATKGHIILDSSAALLLNISPHQTLSINETARDFLLDDFSTALLLFASANSNVIHHNVGFDRIKIWHKFRIQLRSVHHDNVIMPADTVQALPPTDEAVHGTCDTVLVKNHLSSQAIDAFEVVQVRLIFQAILRDEATSLEAFREPLAYVQYFAFTSQRDQHGLLIEEPDIDMYMLKRCLLDNGQPRGGIVRLAEVARPIEIIPVFGKTCDIRFTSQNSLDIGHKYYLNNFSDKEVYAALLNEDDGMR